MSILKWREKKKEPWWKYKEPEENDDKEETDETKGCLWFLLFGWWVLGVKLMSDAFDSLCEIFGDEDDEK